MTIVQELVKTSVCVYERAKAVDELACRALFDEVSLPHKPGLVCPNDNGCHHDMNFELFIKSIHALRGYFGDMFLLGFRHSGFDRLKKRAIEAEHAMLQATAGVNTHRGAIFNLGLVCAAVGSLMQEGKRITPEAVSTQLIACWQQDLLLHQVCRNSHGQQVRRQYGLQGAIEEAAQGFPHVLHDALPAYWQAFRACGDEQRASMQALMALVSVVGDTNIAWRAGLQVLQEAQAQAAGFLQGGGVLRYGWHRKLDDIGCFFKHHKISPGGSADLLAVMLFLLMVSHEHRNII